MNYLLEIKEEIGKAGEMKYNIFEIQKENSRTIEEIIRKKIYILLPTILEPYIKDYNYTLHPNKQLQGIDGGIHFDWDVKARDNSYRWVNDIALEIKTNNKKGWFCKSKADIIFYGITNKKKTDYLQGKTWILFLDNCRSYFTKDKLIEYEKKLAPTHDKITKEVLYWTINRIIPIEDFPNYCLINFPKAYFNFEESKIIIKKKKIGIENWIYNE